MTVSYPLFAWCSAVLLRLNKQYQIIPVVKIPLQVRNRKLIKVLYITYTWFTSYFLLFLEFFKESLPLKVNNYIITAAVAAKSRWSCLTLGNPIDSSPPGSSVPEILQARMLEWGAISFSNACISAKSLQSCLTLCDPIDSSSPGSSVPGILQARITSLPLVKYSISCWLLNLFIIHQSL